MNREKLQDFVDYLKVLPPHLFGYGGQIFLEDGRLDPDVQQGLSCHVVLAFEPDFVSDHFWAIRRRAAELLDLEKSEDSALFIGGQFAKIPWDDAYGVTLDEAIEAVEMMIRYGEPAWDHILRQRYTPWFCGTFRGPDGNNVKRFIRGRTLETADRHLRSMVSARGELLELISVEEVSQVYDPLMDGLVLQSPAAAG